MAKKTTKKTAKKTVKGKKLDNLSQAHGKEERYEPTSLEQIWGDDGMSKYRTLDDLEYSDELDGMTKTEMQAHATKVGVVPIDNVTLLKQRLTKEFHRHINAYRMPKQPVNDASKISKEVRQILEEGK